MLFAVALAGFAWAPAARANPRLAYSILGASAALLAFAFVARLRRADPLRLEFQPRAQHYLQACAQATVMAYWGWYWRPVYDAVPLIAAQLVFAYAFDMMLAWVRRGSYTMGFAPFPVIFSTNLFLWFKADWFFLQFLMIAVGFAAKELIRWERGGRLVHVFNPSSFPLALFSLALIATGSTSTTWGEEIATTQFNPPNIYLLLFLVGLPGQYLFGVTTMTMSAVVTTYLIGLAYFGLTGTYFFIDSYIPIAVFLGMHLLFTDPSTSPRTDVGRVVFGVLYGVGNVVLYALLGALGVPRFYDKLLPVPLMNLSVRWIDAVAPRLLHAVDPARVLPHLTGRRRHLAYIALWTLTFGGMTLADGVGDNHPGHRVPFWADACQRGLVGACETYHGIVAKYCDDGSPWACNEQGVLYATGKVPGPELAPPAFARACAGGFRTGCRNASPTATGPPESSPPLVGDYPVVLRSGKGPIPDRTPMEIFTRACDQGWVSGCEDLAGEYLREPGRDAVRAASLLGSACERGLATSCSNLGLMHYRGDGIPEDRGRGLALLKQSCTMGFQQACRWLAEVPAAGRGGA